HDKTTQMAASFYRDICKKCGAARVDLQLGLEETPEMYVASLVAVFREVRRVLRDDGTVWLNLGDSYVGAANNGGPQGKKLSGPQNATGTALPGKPGRAKNLIGIPWRVAFALQADGWYLRSDIIWHAPNKMPESVTDRPTKSHEYLFLLAKSEQYFYDWLAIAEPYADITLRDADQAYTGESLPGYADAGAQNPSDAKRSILA